MRAGFLLVVLALAGGYTALAFTELTWLSSAGRLGPGFFPRIIGVSLMMLCLYSLYADRRHAESWGGKVDDSAGEAGVQSRRASLV